MRRHFDWRLPLRHSGTSPVRRGGWEGEGDAARTFSFRIVSGLRRHVMSGAAYRTLFFDFPLPLFGLGPILA